MQPVGELAAEGKKGSSWPLTSTVPLVFLVLVVVALVFVYLLVILLVVVVVSKAAPLLTASVTVLVVRISLPAHVRRTSSCEHVCVCVCTWGVMGVCAVVSVSLCKAREKHAWGFESVRGSSLLGVIIIIIDDLIIVKRDAMCCLAPYWAAYTCPLRR